VGVHLLFCAFPFGYGPAAKLLAIAHAVSARGVSAAFVGSGISLELVRRSRDRFTAVADATSQQARALVAESAGVVSLMDRDAAALAERAGKPLFVVDSLLWMRERVPAAFAAARRYWAQRFFGDDGPVRLAFPAASPVGPIVAAFEGRRGGDGIVVHLGGCASPFASSEAHHHYALAVMHALVASGVARGHRCRLLAGEACVARLRAEFPASDVALETLSHDDALRAIAGADLVLTSPGVTATFECFSLGVPAFFLPPQNYSQWLALQALRAAGLAPASLHWSDLGAAPPFASLPEAEIGRASCRERV